MAEETLEEKKIRLEANQWLYKHQDFAQKLAKSATDSLTVSGEFFSKKLLRRTLKDSIEAMTPETTGLSKEEIEELASNPKKMKAVVSTLSDLICESSPSALDKNGKTVYTTQEIVEAEQNILIQAKEMAKRSTEGQPFGNEESIQNAMTELDEITRAASDGKSVMRDDYKKLFNSFLQPSYLQIANGPPGSGKSTLAQGLIYAITKDAIENGKPVPKIYATAPSSKAAGGIVDDIKAVGKSCEKVLDKTEGADGVKTGTVDREWLKEVSENLPEIEGGKPLNEMFEDIGRMEKGDILILDEAGLAGVRDMSKLLTLANERGVRLFMLGDNLQIPPAMAGNGLDELLAKKDDLEIKTTELTVVLRQRDEDEAQWTLDIRAGDPTKEGTSEDRTMKALNGYSNRYYTGFDENGKALYQDVKEGEPIPEKGTPGLQFVDDAHGRLIADYIDFRKEYPHLSSVVMATTKEETKKLQKALRAELIEKGIVHDVKRFGKIDIGIGDTMMLKSVEGLKISKKTDDGHFEPASADDITTGDQLEITGYDKKTKQFTFKKGNTEFVCDAKAFAAQAKHGLVLPLYEAQGASRDRAFMSVGEKGKMDKVHTGVAFSRHEQQMSAYVSKKAYPGGITEFAREAREFSTRKQLYSDGKTMEEVLQDSKKPALQSLIQNLDIGEKTPVTRPAKTAKPSFNRNSNDGR